MTGLAQHRGQHEARRATTHNNDFDFLGQHHFSFESPQGWWFSGDFFRTKFHALRPRSYPPVDSANGQSWLGSALLYSTVRGPMNSLASTAGGSQQGYEHC
jgi:hypothetical protein